MISPIGIVVAIVVLGAWVGLIFVKELIKFKREERRKRKEEAQPEGTRQKNLEMQRLLQEYGDALERERDGEEQIADMIALRRDRGKRQRRAREIEDRASDRTDPER